MNPNLFAVIIRNADAQVWRFIIEEVSKKKALKVARDRVLKESDYRIVSIGAWSVEFPPI